MLLLFVFFSCAYSYRCRVGINKIFNLVLCSNKTKLKKKKKFFFQEKITNKIQMSHLHMSNVERSFR